MDLSQDGLRNEWNDIKCKSQRKKNTLCGQDTEFLNVATDGTLGVKQIQTCRFSLLSVKFSAPSVLYRGLPITSDGYGTPAR